MMGKRVHPDPTVRRVEKEPKVLGVLKHQFSVNAVSHDL